MDVKFLNPFLEAAIEVLKAEVGIQATRGPLSLAQTALTTDDITVLIHMVDGVYGVVLYGMPIATGLAFVSKIMGQEFKEFDSLAQSGVAELGNVISGRATIKFAQAGFEANISPPTIITGKGVQISTLNFSRLVVPLKTELGDMIVHLALRESTPGKTNNLDDFVQLAVAQPSAMTGS